MNFKKFLAIPSIYSKFRRFVGNDQVRQLYADQHIRAFTGARVLDIGCGPGDILRFLPEVDYVGFDISPEYIESARQHFGRRAKFFCEPVGNGINAPADSFDIAIAHGVLHHLNDDESLALFKIAHSSLKPGGRLITFDGCFTKNQSFLAKFFVSQDRGQYVRTQKEYERLASVHFSNIKVAIRTDLIRIPYTHIVMECNK